MLLLHRYLIAHTPVVKMNPPQKLGRVLVDLGEGEYVVPPEQLVCPPSPEGDVGNPNLRDTINVLLKIS